MLWTCFLSVLIHFSIILAETNPDNDGLYSLKTSWQNVPDNWVSTDPCDISWTGIKCNNSRVISIILSGLGVKGKLTGDIGVFTALQILDLSYNKGMDGPLPSAIGQLSSLQSLILIGCSFSGRLPPELGNLQQLRTLDLNSNSFTGQIPPSIGNLSNLYWLDIANNKFEGSIPVSDESSPGLDLLLHTKHFHFSNNSLSGTIPPKLFHSNQKLIHVLFDDNNLIGNIPSTLGLVTSLEVLRLDRNSLSGTVPPNLNNLTSLTELYLLKNSLTGPIPNLTGMNTLSYVDLSNNPFNATDIPSWFSTIRSLTTLVLESVGIFGVLPTELFSSPNLQTVRLKDNNINGTLDIGRSYSSQLQLVDVQNNRINQLVPTNFGNDILLKDNPVCRESSLSTKKYCQNPNITPFYSTSFTCRNTCKSVGQKVCPVDCVCSYPYTGQLIFRAPSFSDIKNSSNFVMLEENLVKSFRNYKIPVPVKGVALYNLQKNLNDNLEMGLDVFPEKMQFNQSEVSTIAFILSNQTFKPPKIFGPFYFQGSVYSYAFADSAPTDEPKSRKVGLIIGAGAGGGLLLLLLVFLGLYAIRRKKGNGQIINRQTQSESYASVGNTPQLQGARYFSYDELRKITNNFSEDCDIGSGGYGKVYKGILMSGKMVAVKRAQQKSLQGEHEFKTEIEMLSRVHHKNVVTLIGFCFDKGEQMLVYEYVPNGSLKDSLSGKSGFRLDWTRRLRVILGSAKGLAYLHELASPPIIHRDIKSTNILLDERLNAKVSDFGLSKFIHETDGSHVLTEIKGTIGYVDPEYYMTQRLTEKSDVYSFGVLMLEIITAKKPIDKGKYIVREIKIKMNPKKDLYGLHELIDPTIGLNSDLPGFKQFVDLAIRCVQETGVERPTMGDVVREIEEILRIAGLNPQIDSASNSATHDISDLGPTHPYHSDHLDSSS